MIRELDRVAELKAKYEAAVHEYALADERLRNARKRYFEAANKMMEDAKARLSAKEPEGNGT